MWLEAVFTREDLLTFLAQLVPVTFRLGERGDLSLDGPFVLSLTPAKGISIACGGKLHWPLFGVSVPATLDSIVVLVRPEVEVRDGGHALIFKLEIEHAAVAYLPATVDRQLVARVNEELSKKELELVWRFDKTLSHLFVLPPALASVEALVVEVTGGSAKVTDSAVGFAVAFKAEVRKRPVTPAGGR